MTPTPKKFAEALRNSTLSAKEQAAILSVLPRLSSAQTETLFEILRKDATRHKKVQLKNETAYKKTLLKMEVELSKIKPDLPKK